MNFDKFNEMYDMDAFMKEYEEAEKNGGGPHEEVPPGVYEVAVEKMELKESKSGKPMVSIWFKIVGNNRKGQFIFFNQLVDTGQKINICNGFLKQLDTRVKIEAKKDWNEYADMIRQIANEIDILKLEYQLNYGKNKNGYSTFKIEQVYEE